MPLHEYGCEATAHRLSGQQVNALNHIVTMAVKKFLSYQANLSMNMVVIRRELGYAVHI